MRSLLRAAARLALLPVVLALGGFIGLLGLATHPKQVLERVRNKGWAVFDSFTPEERKVIRHILLGLLVLAALAFGVALAARAWR